MPSRAIAPVVTVVLLVAITAVLAGVVAVVWLSVDPGSDPIHASISATVDPNTDRFTFEHEGGDPIPVDDLRIEIQIDGEPLRHQPPVPFVGSRGFAGSPSGPFNEAGSAEWSAGERASFRVACTNSPKPTVESTVRIALFVGETPVTTLEVRPERPS